MFYLCYITTDSVRHHELDITLPPFYKLFQCSRLPFLRDYLQRYPLSLIIADPGFYPESSFIPDIIAQSQSRTVPVIHLSEAPFSSSLQPAQPETSITLSAQTPLSTLRKRIIRLIHQEEHLRPAPPDETVPEPPEKTLLIGASQSTRELQKEIRLLSRENHPILIKGETGTGKELIAQEIHNTSCRKEGPYIATNCAANPPSLFESLFWGTVRGAYTDAVHGPGFIETAHGGSLFLDEIGDLDPGNQAKLLRALENKTICRLGSHRKIPVDVRYIFASNQDLEKKIQEERFRKDLFYRISAFKIQTVPLRDREEDILDLCEFFLTQEKPTSPPAISASALEKLISHPWPGNVRELRNVILRALVYSNRKTITREDIRF
ncbi:MAG: sigma 54-interacting transcriptional regulator [Spirochaetales bacterium]|nr:sigma 54-interacting transcriptional regulator [Spirochaetales bacterium]